MKKYFEGMSNFRDGRKDRVNSLEEGRVKGEIMREVGERKERQRVKEGEREREGGGKHLSKDPVNITELWEPESCTI